MPDSTQVSFIEGDKDGEIDCVMIRIINDSDFERIEVFTAFIDASIVIRGNVFNTLPVLTTVEMKSTEVQTLGAL